MAVHRTSIEHNIVFTIEEQLEYHESDQSLQRQDTPEIPSAAQLSICIPYGC